MDKIQLQKLKVLGLGLIVVLSTIGFFAVNTSTQADTIDLNQVFTSALILEIEGIPGESLHEDAKDGIDILSFSWGITVPGSGATGATRYRSAAILSDFFILKEMDKSSPKLYEAASKGTFYPVAKITSYAGNGGFNYQFELKNVMITSVQVTAGGGEGPPVESLSINFEEIKFTYTERAPDGKAKGSVEYSWKVEEGEG